MLKHLMNATSLATQSVCYGCNKIINNNQKKQHNRNQGQKNGKGTNQNC